MLTKPQTGSSARIGPPDGFPAAPAADHAARLADPSRLKALKDADLLDTLPEEVFDRVTRLATRLLGVPVSLMSLVDTRRQFFKSQTGLEGEVAETRETPLSHSFCQYVVTEDRSLSVSDARVHPLLAGNGAVSDLSVIAYLGEPIHAPGGAVIGSLCAIDSMPHDWSDDDRATMRDLAAILENELRLREESRRSDLILGEMHHRIKNLFTVSSALLRASAREADDTTDLVQRFEGRLNALSRSHSMAVGTSDQTTAPEFTGIQLAHLVDHALAPFASGPGVAVQAGGPEVFVTSNSVTYLALTLHELATNALKYGGLRDDDGKVHIRWERDEDSGNIIIDWTEICDLPDAEAETGFGSGLLENAIRFGLSGEFDRNLRSDGIRYKITLPATVAV
ncbi:GAF domain-containing protein [Rhodobacterales bacterium HKCCE4037]|nr:GAF domain-containing protein [Rhodobacterales bacterium HKCCE4037]